jgi:hypothetical protein
MKLLTVFLAVAVLLALCSGSRATNASAAARPTSSSSSASAPEAAVEAALASRLAAAAGATVTCTRVEPLNEAPALVCELAAAAAPQHRRTATPPRVSVFTVFFRTEEALVRARTHATHSLRVAIDCA